MVPVKENIALNTAIYKMVLDCPDVDLSKFVPGQFADIEIPGHAEMLLKRPFSIHAVSREDKTVTLIYQIAGKGTEALVDTAAGTQLNAILPIGRGFDLCKVGNNILLVGGGVGIAPLLPVTKHWPYKQYRACLGYRSKDLAYAVGAYDAACDSVAMASDDGSIGIQGVVTDIVRQELGKSKPDMVLACGPTPMLKALKDLLLPLGIPAQFSLEQRMACGFGACATCVCGIDKGDGLSYKKVCTEGPVFDMNEVAL
jgi:dihydroorotate dehydrogenase electron transfer subunit